MFGNILMWTAVWATMVAAQQPSQPLPLAVGHTVSRRIEGTERQQWAVSLQAGEHARVVVRQMGVDLVVSLLAPGGTPVMVADSPNGFWVPETVGVVAPAPATYIVEVRTFSGKSAASYDITLATLRPAQPGDPEWAEAQKGFQDVTRLMNKRTPETRAEAMRLAETVLPVFASQGETLHEGLTYLMRGTMLAESGDMRAALDANRKCAALFANVGSVRDEAVARSNIGGMLDVLGEPDAALESYARALALNRSVKAIDKEAIVLNNAGKLHSDLGNWQTALDHFRQALPLARQVGDLRRQALITHNLGYVFYRLGEVEEAITHFEQALPLRRAAKDKRGEGETLQGLAGASRLRNQHDKEKQYLRDALALFSETGDRRKEAEIRRDLGRAAVDEGDLDGAAHLLEQALQGARTAGDRRSAALTLLHRGDLLLRRGDPAKAAPAAAEAAAEFQSIGDRSGQASATELRARAEAAQGNLPAARQWMEQALTITEDTRTRAASDQLRASFLASQQGAYSFYIGLLMQLGDAAAALEASERSRARSLLDMLTAQGAEIRAGAGADLLARERAIANTLNAKGARLLAIGARATAEKEQLAREIRSLELEAQEVAASIRNSNPRYATLTQPNPLRLREIQEELDAGTVLLQYSLGDAKSYLWAVTHTGLQWYELPGQADLAAQVDRIHQLLTARARTVRLESAEARQARIEQADRDLPRAADHLGRTLLAPAAALLARHTRVAIAAEGPLQRIPFAMLTFGRQALVETHETVVLPSASALRLLRRDNADRPPAPKLLAIFADPVFGNQANGPATASRVLEHAAAGGASTAAAPAIPRLPYTRQEAEQILKVARTGNTLRAFGYEANRAAALDGRLAAYRYLHFATHGFLDTERPSLSALVLSQVNERGEPQEGFLRVGDIYNTRIGADLVVLSACETGLGKEVRGEGLMGLTRAFLYAGSPRVVVSLWNVNDRATAGLMSAFYRKMWRDGRSATAALREAQREMRKSKQWAAPYYWAAFVQHGEWR